MSGYRGLINQVYSLPELIRQQYMDLESKTRSVLSTPEIFRIMRIVLTGCGDSFAAALSVRDAFMELTGLSVEAIPAIELSRSFPENYFGWAPDDPLVIAVSNSGCVARMNEAVRRASVHGAFTLGVTGNSSSPLAKASNRILELSVPPFESAPGTRSYAVSLVALLLLAIRIGEVRGRYTMDKGMAMRLDMLRQADLLDRMLPEIDSKMQNLASDWIGMEAFDFIGTGMEFGTAWYCHAKILEMLGKYSFFQNSEDWLHTNLFLRKNETTAAVVFCDDRNPALGRTLELIGYAKDLKRPLLVIGDGLPESIQVPKSDYYFNSCLTDFVPVNILANYIADIIGEEDGRGCKGVWSIAEGAKCIRNSEIRII